MREFVTVDFETANEQRRSACAVGLVHYDSAGTAAEEYHTLIHPHPDCDYFSPINTWIHGITADDVAAAPSWRDVAAQIYEFIGDLPLVAHNMAFDGYVLSDLASLYQLPQLANRRMCTMRLARRILADQLEHKRLDDVYNCYFPGETFPHHDAAADARACGRIFARMQQEYSWEQLEELCPAPDTRSRSRKPRMADQLTVDDLLAQYATNPHALAGEHVCITGTLQHGKRASVQALIEAVGGVADNNLTKKTTILVIGVSNPRTFAAGASVSSKMRKASQLREAGSPIELLSEQEFFQRLIDEA